MKNSIKGLLLFGCGLLSACDQETSVPDAKQTVLQPQMDALAKAKAVDQAVQDAAMQRQQALEAAEQK